MFKISILLLGITSLISMAYAQHKDYGVSTNVWSTSNPHNCAHWIAKYIPNASETAGNCPDGICECGQQGRYQLGSPTDGFGLHAVNCTRHPHGDLGLANVEFKVLREVDPFDKFHPFMDYNTGFWVGDLDHYIEAFVHDDVQMTQLKWKGDDNKDYYSIIVKPCGQVIFELMGSMVSKVYEDQFIADDHMRMSMKSKHNLPAGFDKREHSATHDLGGEPAALVPVKISRATARMDKVKKFYTAEIGVKMEFNKEYDDGSELAIFTFNYPVNVGVQLHFWQGRTQEESKLAKAEKELQRAQDIQNYGHILPEHFPFGVSDFETYMNGQHTVHMKDHTCGIDQWADNHFKYENPKGIGILYIDEYAKHLKANKLRYHWSKNEDDTYFIHGVDPTGFGIKFAGKAKDPPKIAPLEVDFCKSNDGCKDQGMCWNSKTMSYNGEETTSGREGRQHREAVKDAADVEKDLARDLAIEQKKEDAQKLEDQKKEDAKKAEHKQIEEDLKADLEQQEKDQHEKHQKAEEALKKEQQEGEDKMQEGIAKENKKKENATERAALSDLDRKEEQQKKQTDNQILNDQKVEDATEEAALANDDKHILDQQAKEFAADQDRIRNSTAKATGEKSEIEAEDGRKQDALKEKDDSQQQTLEEQDRQKEKELKKLDDNAESNLRHNDQIAEEKAHKAGDAKKEQELKDANRKAEAELHEKNQKKEKELADEDFHKEIEQKQDATAREEGQRDIADQRIDDLDQATKDDVDNIKKDAKSEQEKVAEIEKERLAKEAEDAIKRQEQVKKDQEEMKEKLEEDEKKQQETLEKDMEDERKEIETRKREKLERDNAAKELEQYNKDVTDENFKERNNHDSEHNSPYADENKAQNKEAVDLGRQDKEKEKDEKSEEQLKEDKKKEIEEKFQAAIKEMMKKAQEAKEAREQADKDLKESKAKQAAAEAAMKHTSGSHGKKEIPVEVPKLFFS